MVDVLASLVTKAISSIGSLLPPAGKRASESKEEERHFIVLRGAALVMYKASPTSRLKGSAALAQLLKAICSFSCQLIVHPSQTESNVNLSFVCLRACIKWFGFNPNVFASLRETVFQAAFGVADDKRPIMSSAPAAAAVLCVNIALASCDLSSPPVTSICAALASAIMSCPSNSQLIQASSVPLPLPCQYFLAISRPSTQCILTVSQEMARARVDASLSPLGNGICYDTVAPVLLDGIGSENASLRIGVLRLMVAFCEEAEKKGTTQSSSSSTRGSGDVKPAKKRKASAAEIVAVHVDSRTNDSHVAAESDAPAHSSGPSVSVTMLQLMRLAGSPLKFNLENLYSYHISCICCAVDIEEAPMNALDRGRVRQPLPFLPPTTYPSWHPYVFSIMRRAHCRSLAGPPPSASCFVAGTRPYDLRSGARCCTHRCWRVSYTVCYDLAVRSNCWCCSVQEVPFDCMAGFVGCC